MSEVRAEWFGAKGDGMTDDTAALMAALDQSRCGTLRLSRKTYAISQPLNLSTTRIVGEHWWRLDEGGTLLKALIPMPSMIYSNSNRCGVENLGLLCEKKAAAGVRLYHSHDTMVQNVAIRDSLEAGLDSDGSTFAIDRVTAYCNVGLGFRIKDCNGSAFRSVKAFLNTGGGMHVESVAQASGFVIDGNSVFETNDGFDLDLLGINTCSQILGGHFETKAGVDSIRMRNCRHVSVLGTRLTGGDVAGQAEPGRGLSLRGYIEGCSFRDVRMAYGPEYEHVILSDQCWNNTFDSCLHLGQAGTPMPLRIDGPGITHNTVR